VGLLGSSGSRRWCWVSATVSSGEERLGRTAGRRGRTRGGQRGVGEGGSEAGEDAWLASERLWSGGARHMAGTVAAARRREETEEEGGR
jgi:hypothetical protein